LAGEPPCRSETAFAVALKHVQAAPPALQRIRPDLPAELCAVVHKMMAKKPEERYQTGRDLLRDLTRVREGISGGGSAPQLFSDLGETPKTVVEMPLSGGRRRLLPVAAAVSLVLATLAGAGFGWYYRLSA